MDYHIPLTITYIFLFIVSLCFFQAKLISPSVIFSCSFSAMLILSLISKEILDISVNWITFSVFSVAGLIFFFTELVVFLFFHGIRISASQRLSGVSFVPFEYSKQFRIFWIFVLIISIGFTFLSIYASGGGGSFLHRMQTYKNMLTYSPDKVKFRFALNQIRKIALALAVIYNYVLIYNVTVLRRNAHQYFDYIFSQILFVILMFFGAGARQEVVELIVNAALIYIALHIRKSEFYKIRRMIWRMIPAIALAMPIFTYTATWAGRRNIKRKVIEYISKYVCGGLYAFNAHTNEPMRTEYWGQSSFANVYSFLRKFGLAENVPDIAYHEFDRYGNTVTMFGRWYEDFGSAGVFIMTFLVALFFSIFFYRFIAFSAPHSSPSHHLARIMYCKLLLALVWAGYDDRIRPLFAFHTLVVLILISISYTICASSRLQRLKRKIGTIMIREEVTIS